MGIDPHKKSHTATAVDEVGKPLDDVTVPARVKGFERLLGWARRLDDDRLFAIEDCRHVSGSLERFLIARGERVVRVPPKLMAGARRSQRTPGKSDPVDAVAVAHAALRTPDLPTGRLEGPERDLRLLLDHREDLVEQRTAVQNRLRWHVHDIDPAIDVPLRSLGSFKWLELLETKLAHLKQTAQVEIARELVEDCWRLSRRVNVLQRRIGRLVAERHPELLAIPGCAALTAAKLVGEIAGIDRFTTESKLAMHAGVGPLEASSGNRQRHRLNRKGNRQLNAALHRIAVTQMRCHEPARIFMERKQQEGKNKREALRCLKRHLARVVFNTMKNQAAAQPMPPATAVTDLQSVAA